jgi:hypothetical protein
MREMIVGGGGEETGGRVLLSIALADEFALAHIHWSTQTEME